MSLSYQKWTWGVRFFNIVILIKYFWSTINYLSWYHLLGFLNSSTFIINYNLVFWNRDVKTRSIKILEFNRKKYKIWLQGRCVYNVKSARNKKTLLSVSIFFGFVLSCGLDRLIWWLAPTRSALLFYFRVHPKRCLILKLKIIFVFCLIIVY